MGSTVLLLEDEPLIRELLETALSDDGHDVVVCESPEQVIEVGRQSPRSLAVVDFWGHSYGTLSEAERADVRRLADAVPTILVTARTWAQDRPAADLGLLAVVRKPFDLDELSGLVTSWAARLNEDSTNARAYARDVRDRNGDALERLRAIRARMSSLAGTHAASLERQDVRRRDP